MGVTATPGAAGLLLYSGSARSRCLCTSFPARVELTRSLCPRPQPRLGARGEAGTRPGSAPRHSQRRLRSPPRCPPQQHALPRHPGVLGDKTQQQADTQTAQGKRSHQVPKPAVCVVCGAGAGVKSH